MDENTGIKEHQQALFRLLQEFDRVCRSLDIGYTLYAGTLLGAVRHGGFIPWDDDLDVIMPRADYARFLAEGEKMLGEGFFLQKEFSEHWPMFFSKLRLDGTACLEKYHPKDEKCHQGVYMDIFPMDNAASGRLGRHVQFFAARAVTAKSLYRRGYDTKSVLKKSAMLLSLLLPIKILRAIAAPKKQSGFVHGFFAATSSIEKSVFPAEWFSKITYLSFEGKPFPVPEKFRELLTGLYGDYMTLPAPEERLCKRHALLVDLENSWEFYGGFRDGMSFADETRSIR